MFTELFDKAWKYSGHILSNWTVLLSGGACNVSYNYALSSVEFSLFVCIPTWAIFSGYSVQLGNLPCSSDVLTVLAIFHALAGHCWVWVTGTPCTVSSCHLQPLIPPSADQWTSLSGQCRSVTCSSLRAFHETAIHCNVLDKARTVFKPCQPSFRHIWPLIVDLLNAHTWA